MVMHADQSNCSTTFGPPSGHLPPPKPSTKDEVDLTPPVRVSSPSMYSQTILPSSSYPPSPVPPHAHGQPQVTPSTAIPRTRASPYTPAPNSAPATSQSAKPVAPVDLPRYKRRNPIDRNLSNKTDIVPGKISYAGEASEGWQRVVHPEGACYFFNSDKQVFTDIDVTRASNLSSIDECIEFLRDKEDQVLPQPCQPPRTQLVLQWDSSGRWCYYFVNHASRVVFWVDPFDGRKLLRDLHGVVADSHIGYAIEMQYWHHCEDFPNCIPVSEDDVNEAWGILSQAFADRVTSKSPLSTLDDDQLGKILSLVPYLQVRVGQSDSYALWVIARVMANFARVKFYNFYGQAGARLEANLSVYAKADNDPDENSWLFFLLDPLFFCSPSAHIRELKSIWVDDVINYARWKIFANKLSIEWNGFTIYSTVMLAVDVSFLAVPGVDKGVVNSQSVATVATYMSLLSIVGSVLSSLLLARQSLAQEESAVGVATFMHRMTRWGVGCNALGIMFSLPFVLLMWAMVSFLLALCYVIFQSTDPSSWGFMIPGAILVAILALLPDDLIPVGIMLEEGRRMTTVVGPSTKDTTVPRLHRIQPGPSNTNHQRAPSLNVVARVVVSMEELICGSEGGIPKGTRRELGEIVL
ncbi:hypothetical protein PAXINDRAFT_101119 [Paxillus involutus ATCC 200175]|uniref:WW domain-containing protein n=1 Tax=Paxillus involutus ATCC 200175 TaxID=664439 RepID=A0A0C9TZG7_PAXIN|nr:hypothetical protein PAXINDRAFT_101119 [Paxillus involutus ATCC 200175]